MKPISKNIPIIIFLMSALFFLSCCDSDHYSERSKAFVIAQQDKIESVISALKKENSIKFIRQVEGKKNTARFEITYEVTDTVFREINNENSSRHNSSKKYLAVYDGSSYYFGSIRELKDTLILIKILEFMKEFEIYVMEKSHESDLISFILTPGVEIIYDPNQGFSPPNDENIKFEHIANDYYFYYHEFTSGFFFNARKDPEILQ